MRVLGGRASGRHARTTSSRATQCLRGTLRTFTPDQRARRSHASQAILAEVEAMFVVACTLQAARGRRRPCHNDAEVVQRVMASARARRRAPAASSRCRRSSPSDDVVRVLEPRVRAATCFVGGALPDGSSGMHHGPDFAVDDDACRVMAGVLAASAVDLAQS